MKKHINADFFKLILAFFIICISLNPGIGNSAVKDSSSHVVLDFSSSLSS